MSGFFTVGARAGFPIDGVDFIMGNDIAGGKVYPVPEVVCTPIPESESDKIAIKHPQVFVASVTTRAQGRKQAQDVNLSDSFFASVLSGESETSGGGRVSCPGGEPIEKVTDSVLLADSSAPLAPFRTTQFDSIQ